jgi:hypothetical protein
VDTFRDFVDSYRRPYRLWQSTYTHSADVDAFRRWLKLVLDPARSRDLGEGYGYSSIHDFAGLLTYRYLWLFSRDVEAVLDKRRFRDVGDLVEFDQANNMLNYVIKTENLEAGLIEAIHLAGHTLTDERKKEIYRGQKAKTNTSRHLSTAQYFDRETADLVRQKDRFIIEKYGYSFPDELKDVSAERLIAAQ